MDVAKSCFLLAWTCLTLLPPAAAQDRLRQNRPRLLVLTDFYKDPDDKQSLIRLLSYANEFEIEGFVATSLAYGDGSLHPEWIREVIGEYGKVLKSAKAAAGGAKRSRNSADLAAGSESVLREFLKGLRRHERRGFPYPSAESLAGKVRPGAPVIRKLVGTSKGFPVPYPPGARDSRSCDPAEKWLGAGRDTPGSRLIAEVVDRDDPRPVWITVWGGAMDLAQALWQVRNSRTPEQQRRFVEKLRVYQISWQDTGAVWIWENFPGLFLVLNAESMRGIYSEGPVALRDEKWVDENVRRRGGALGAGYPRANPPGVKEGDTPSFLHLLAKGLSDPEHPEWGGWGGRFRRLDERRRFYVPAEDNHPESADEQRRKAWAVGRWNEAAAHGFAARMDWCVRSFENANHDPVAVVGGDRTPTVLHREAVAGERIRLDASKSTDPDGDALDYRWWQYREAGSLKDAVAIENASAARAGFLAPAVTRPETLHVVLSVTDRGSPPLTSYRRLIFTVRPAARQGSSQPSR